MTLTAEQFAKVATNYVLAHSSEYQVLKVTKQAPQEVSPWLPPVMVVNVRVINTVGKKTTMQVYISESKDLVWGDFYGNGDISAKAMLELSIENPVFGTLEEEQAKIEQAKAEQAMKEAQRAFDNTIRYIGSEHKRMSARYQLGLFERSMVKKGADTLATYVPYLEGEVKKFVERCIVLAEQKAASDSIKTSYRSKDRTVFYSTEVESIIAQIEDSIAQYEGKIYEMELATLKEEGADATLRSLEAQAADYVENQKCRLMCAVIRDLHKLDIASVTNGSIRNHNNGFEGYWKLTLADGSVKFYTTNSIIAGGYNIQRMHYRYLTNLS